MKLKIIGFLKAFLKKDFLGFRVTHKEKLVSKMVLLQHSKKNKQLKFLRFSLNFEKFSLFYVFINFFIIFVISYFSYFLIFFQYHVFS